MKIYLTYDYELFFGHKSGTLEKCILQPTEQLIQIANKHHIKMVFFIDVGYIKKLSIFKDQFPELNHDYELITKQIKNLSKQGHDCQLHIHPHWEDTTYANGEWQMNTTRYKLSDFKETEIEKIVKEYHAILTNITNKPVQVFRAGGWCIQPFIKLKKCFSELGIQIDTSVYPGGVNKLGGYDYDFTKTPNKSKWNFSSAVCIEDENGKFIEYPISSYSYAPFFFWRLFLLGRIFPSKHKPIGDGYPMPSPGLRKTMLTKGKLLCASVDGYFVTKLNRILAINTVKKFNDFVIIGHPKALTNFSLKKLDAFIEKHKTKHEFTILSNEILNT